MRLKLHTHRLSCKSKQNNKKMYRKITTNQRHNQQYTIQQTIDHKHRQNTHKTLYPVHSHHLICVKQLPHCGTRAPGATDLFRTPRPRFGADVAPNVEPLLLPLLLALMLLALLLLMILLLMFFRPALAGDGSLTTLCVFVLVRFKPDTDTDVDFEAMVV